MPRLYIAHALPRHNQSARFLFALVILVLAFSMLAGAQQAPRRAPIGPQLAALDSIVEKSIAADEIPGAVLVVGHRGRAVFRKAYGSRAVLPQREPMTVDTVFDLASLTKVVATTSAVMKLLEQGKIRLNDPIARYLPELAAGRQDGKDQVTLRQLMTHTAGLSPIPRRIADPGGTEQMLQAIYDDALVSPPGSRFLYSDSGFI